MTTRWHRVVVIPCCALALATTPKGNDAKEHLPEPLDAVPAAIDLDWPEERSPAPSSEEWQDQPSVAPTRAVGGHAKNCVLRRVREWVSIRCLGMKTSAISQLGGLQQGVSFHLDPTGEDRLPNEGVLVFPLRRGERRVFTFWTLGDGYDGPLTVIAGVVVQAEWTGDRPVLLMHDAVVEPVRTAHGLKRQQQAQSNETRP